MAKKTEATKLDRGFQYEDYRGKKLNVVFFPKSGQEGRYARVYIGEPYSNGQVGVDLNAEELLNFLNDVMPIAKANAKAHNQ